MIVISAQIGVDRAMLECSQDELAKASSSALTRAATSRARSVQPAEAWLLRFTAPPRPLALNFCSVPVTSPVYLKTFDKFRGSTLDDYPLCPQIPRI